MLTARLMVVSAGVTALMAFASGCSSDAADRTSGGTTQDRSTGSVSSPMIGGDPSTDHPEVGFTVAGGGVAGFIENGAVLIAPNLIVTQIKAVTKDVYYPPASQGTNQPPCGTVSGIQDPSQISFVYGTTDPVSYISGGATGSSVAAKQVITNGEVDTCKGPLAFVVLQSAVPGVTSFPKLQLDQLPNANDPVTQCAWGETDTHCVEGTSIMCVTGNVTLPNGGYYAPNQIQFPPGFFLTSANECYDDGGAIYDGTGGMFGLIGTTIPAPDVKNTSTEACKTCDGAITSAILLSAQKDLVVRAFAAIGSTPWREGHQQPANVGGTCTDDLDCNSQMCVEVGKQGYCSQDCSSSTCPASTVCTSFGAQSVCLPQVSPHPASCSVSEGGANSNRIWGLVGIALAMIGAVRIRARKRQEG